MGFRITKQNNLIFMATLQRTSLIYLQESKSDIQM